MDYLFSIPFTKEIQDLSPVDFIDKLLIGHFHMKEAYCGYNFRFGKKAQGDVEALMREGLKKGFGIHDMEPYLIDGEPVNSTMIRKLMCGVGALGASLFAATSAFAQDAEHCADGVAIPAFLKRYRAAHNAERAHEIFKLFVYVADFVRHLAAFKCLRAVRLAYQYFYYHALTP